MSNLIPKEMHPKDIAAILRDMAEGVESGDSLEGSIEFLLPEPPEWVMRGEPQPEGWVDDERDYRLVRGTYRIGNTMGSGGVRMIGEVPTSPQAPQGVAADTDPPYGDDSGPDEGGEDGRTEDTGADQARPAAGEQVVEGEGLRAADDSRRGADDAGA